MDNERERLIELLFRAHHNASSVMSETGDEDEAITVEANYLLVNGVTVQRWIPVTERLPEEDVAVLCFSDSYGGTRFIGYIDYRCKAWIEDGMLHIGNVTHWMPLPKPPKGGVSMKPRIVCAETECEYFSMDGCTAEEINLTAGHMHTVHEGYRHVWTCRTFRPSPEAKEIYDMLKSYIDAVNAKAKEEK